MNTTKIKVIFLDWDGVTNRISDKPSRSTQPRVDEDGNLVHAEPELVGRLNRIVEETGCRLVLSSSWRHDPMWRANMRAQGITHEFLDLTPLRTHDVCTPFRTKDSPCRGDNVREWLEAHPEVGDYAILDDTSDFLPEQASHLYRCRSDEGLTEGIALEIIERFNF